MIKKFDVCVLGLGYVGLPTALIIAKNNFKVIGVDINNKLIERLNNYKIDIKEKKIEKLFFDLSKRKKIFFSKSIIISDIYVICVPTPLKKNKPDTSFVLNAVDSLIPFLKNGDTIIIESTCPVGTTQKIKNKINKFYKDKLIYRLAYCPERVLPGNILHEIIHNDKIVGGIDDKSTNYVKKFFSKIIKGNIHKTNSQTAELCKLVENSFRDLNIAFANQISMLCSNNNIDYLHLINLANQHKRVNILSPSIGVGGHCIPVDPVFLVDLDKKNSSLISLSRSINIKKTNWIYSKIINELDALIQKNKNNYKILCLGLSYKSNVGDIRESPALKIFKKLKKDKRFIVHSHDPYINMNEPYMITQLNHLKRYDIFLKLVDHDIFKKLSYKNLFKKKKLIDLSHS